MKKPILVYSFLIIVLFISSCNKKYETALKSSDPEEIINIAKEYYEKGKYENASQLFQHSKKFVYGTEYAKDVDYYSALTSMAAKNYPLAAQEFSTYATRYRRDSLAEEAQYKAAYCFYKGSLPYNLDPKNTYSAIAEMQKFINLYPESERVEECNQYISELHSRLEQKAFENAKTLFKIARYNSSAVAFDNMIDEYPDSQFVEEAMWYSFQSKAEFAFNSYRNLEKDRLIEAVTSYKLLKKNFPNSEYISDAEKILDKINDEFEIVKEWETAQQNKKITNQNNI